MLPGGDDGVRYLDGDTQVEIGSSGASVQKEHLLVSKVLPILSPTALSACSDLSRVYQAYGFSSHATF